MNEKLARITKIISLTSLSLAFILTPLFFLPLTTDFFGFQKQTLFLILISLSLLSWLIYNLATKSVRLTLSPMLLPLSLFTAVAILSTYLNDPNPTDAWINRTSLYLGLLIYYLLTTRLIKSSRQVRRLLNGLIITTVLLSFWGILSVLGVFESLNLPIYLTLKNFSPTGSLLTLVSLLIYTLPLSLVLAFKTRAGPNKFKYFLASGLTISAIILVGSQLLPNRPFSAILLPKLAGWSIAIDTFKSSVLLGAGPSGFLNQFTSFKPLSLNLSDFWNIAFTASANEYLHIMTTLGLAGITTFGLVIFSWLKLSQRDPGTRITATQLAIKLAIFTTLILGLFIPYTIITWVTLIGYLSLTIGLNKSKNLTKVKDVILTINAITIVEPHALTPQTKQSNINSSVLPWLIALPTLLGLIFSGANYIKIYAADYHFNKSLIAASENRGTDTYNSQVKAISLAPNIDRYHTAYSNTNLALANALASQQGDLTDQDRQTITQLIQQSLREARFSTQINPSKAANWANLANIYRQLVNFAEGADQFAQASYIRAIQLDPANPRLRLDLGGLLYSQGQYDQATNHFLEAVQLKPDFANAYYNLANAYQQQAKILEAYQTMQQVVALVPPDSPDYTKAQEELSQLKALLPQQAEQPTPTTDDQQPQELTEPSPPPPAPRGFFPLKPNEQPEPPASPSPSPQPSPSP